MMAFFQKKSQKAGPPTLDIGIVWGGYYAYVDNNSHHLLRILDFNKDVIHYALYNQSFDHEPTVEDIERVRPAIGHVPQDAGVILSWIGLKLIYRTPLTKTDLEGYKIYRKSLGMPGEHLDKLLERLISYSQNPEALNIRIAKQKNGIHIEPIKET